MTKAAHYRAYMFALVILMPLAALLAAPLRQGAVWTDTAGYAINAHGGGMLYHEGTYYWYGEHKVYGKAGNRAHVGVHVYSSRNLYEWEDRGIALAVEDNPQSLICDGCVIERPKVVRSPKTGKFVMYFHLELRQLLMLGKGYFAAYTGVAVADSPTGPFAFVSGARPGAGKQGRRKGGCESRDQTLFVDDDGSVWHIYATDHNMNMRADRLTDDCLDCTDESHEILTGEEAEAPALFKAKGKYWMIASGCTGWAPNKARLYCADRMSGPWKFLGNPCKGVCPANGIGPEKTWGGQSTFVLPVAGKSETFIAMFDMWNPKNQLDSRYIWLPVAFTENSVEVVWNDVCASIGVLMLSTAFVAAEGGEELKLFQTTESKDFREIATSGFTIHPYPAVEALDIDNAVAKHEFLALGASLTDASAWILANMPKEKRENLMRQLFTPEGCNLGAIRLNIGASDYSTGLYSYDDVPGDVEMKHFSLARDDEFLVPMTRAAKALRPDLYVFASPWSPPGWMKTSGMMISGNLKDEFMPALANYFVKYIQGYAARGIAIDAMTPQNETMCETGGQYPCCTYPAAQEGVLIRDHIVPAFRKAGINTKIWVHDHDPDASGIKRVGELLSIPGVEKSVDGVAWHCYSASYSATNIVPLKASHLRLGFYHTENGPHVVIKDRTEFWWSKKVFGMLQSGCSMFTSWNLCLDELGTPATGAHLCGGFTVIDSETHDVTYSPQYRLFRHIGPFVKRGAHVMEVAGSRDGTNLMLFRNPDGEYVLVVACDGTLVRRIQRRRLVVKYKGKYKSLPMPGGQWSVSTLLFK